VSRPAGRAVVDCSGQKTSSNCLVQFRKAKDISMRCWLLLCLLTFTLCGLAQTGDWRRLMAQAAAFDGAGQYAEAAAEYRRALHLVEQSSSGDGRLPGILNALASASINLGDFKEAERQYRRALSLVEATAGKENANTFSCWEIWEASTPSRDNKLWPKTFFARRSTSIRRH
jgi:tetratricopeptide (TPR) repeat protein